MLMIRKCQPNDQKAVRNLIARVLNGEFPKEAENFPTDDLDDIPSAYGKLGEAFFVAVNSGKIIGTVAIKREDNRTALLRRLFVDAPHRRKRIGTKLLEHAIQFCRDVGYDELIFKTTSTMHNAVQLCEKRGFVSRARLNIGPVQLLKFALFLKGEVLLPQSKSASS